MVKVPAGGLVVKLYLGQPACGVRWGELSGVEVDPLSCDTYKFKIEFTERKCEVYDTIFASKMTLCNWFQLFTVLKDMCEIGGIASKLTYNNTRGYFDRQKKIEHSIS